MKYSPRRWSNHMDGATITGYLQALQKEKYEEGIQWFEHDSFNLNVYFLNRFCYLTKYVATALLWLLLPAITTEVICGGEVIIQQLPYLLSLWYFCMLVGFVVFWMLAWALCRAIWGHKMVNRTDVVLLGFSLLCLVLNDSGDRSIDDDGGVASFLTGIFWMLFYQIFAPLETDLSACCST